MEKIKIVVGFDQREAIAYHTFCQSVIERASCPIEFLPLSAKSFDFYKEDHGDNSNDFIYSRFLTPYLNNYKGWAIFADGDMLCNSDISELWAMRDSSKALQVVKHNYKTKQKVKYLGNKNENYPKKNWSSLIIWNCEHPKHKILTPKFVNDMPGSYLHRFSWLEDNEVGELPMEWNWLAIEYDKMPNPKLIHYTLGTPCFKDYSECDYSEDWINTYNRVNDGMQL